MAGVLEDDLGFLVARTYRVMQRTLMMHLEPLGITYPQFQVLNALRDEDNISQIALADRVHVDKTSLARMLDRMEKADLISRSVDTSDSRVNRIMLTSEGRCLVGQVAPLRSLTLDSALQGLNEKEVADLKRLLKRIYENLR